MLKDWSVVLFFIGLVLMPALIGAVSIVESPFKRQKALAKARKKKSNKVLDLELEPVRLPIETLIEQAHASAPATTAPARASFVSEPAPAQPAASQPAVTATSRGAQVSTPKIMDPIPVCLPTDRAPLLQPLLMPDVRSPKVARHATVVAIREALGSSSETVEVLWSHEAEDYVFELVRRKVAAKAQPISRYI